LRSDTPSLAYAALVLQALYYIPQVRLTVSNLRLPVVDADAPLRDPSTLVLVHSVYILAQFSSDRAMWNLIELFTNMDLAQLAAIIDKDVIPSLEIAPLPGTNVLAEESAGVYLAFTTEINFNMILVVVKNIAGLIEEHLQAQAGDEEFIECATL
jgi:hypothetical protein